MNFFNRYSVEMQYQLENTIREAFMYLPKAVKHMGSSVGIRGGNSKSSYDFELILGILLVVLIVFIEFQFIQAVRKRGKIGRVKTEDIRFDILFDCSVIIGHSF